MSFGKPRTISREGDNPCRPAFECRADRKCTPGRCGGVTNCHQWRTRVYRRDDTPTKSCNRFSERTVRWNWYQQFHALNAFDFESTEQAAPTGIDDRQQRRLVCRRMANVIPCRN